MINKTKTIDIGITTVIYNGYGKFLNNFLRFIADLRTKPTIITVVLGKNHGVGSGIVWPPNVNVVYAEWEDNLGKLKNLGVLHTNTEWIMAMSIDDEILPWAIDEYAKHTWADIIVSKYITLGRVSRCMHPRISKEVLLSRDYYTNGRNYMHGSTPFRKALWEKNRYHEGECYNTLFWIDCAKENARFSHTEVPCLIYNIWKGSHSDISREERQRRFNIINNYRIKKSDEIINL